MLEALSKVFADLKLSADIWFIILMVVVVAAFVVTLVVGLVVGKLKSVKSAMHSAVANPNAVVGAMKKMPADIKGQYRTARMTNTKPSVLITEQVCVDEPYKSSLVSKVWLVTLVATLVCAAIAFLMIPMATAVEAMNALGGEMIEALAEGAEEAEEAAAAVETLYAPLFGGYVGPTVLLVLGGILTLVGGLIGKAVHAGSAKLYAKFVPVMDGEAGGAQPQMQQQMHAQYNEAPVYGAEAQEAPMYAAEHQDAPMYSAEPQDTPVYSAEPQAEYGAPTQEPVYEQAAPVVNEQQESDEEIRRRAREEALAQARAQQQAAQAQAQAAQQPRAQATSGSSVDDVIAKINDIEANGASRETMREVATQLQKERAKPENKTPDTQKRLNEALSKLLKAMSAATKK